MIECYNKKNKKLIRLNEQLETTMTQDQINWEEKSTKKHNQKTNHKVGWVYLFS
jgi:hypothetical protein